MRSTPATPLELAIIEAAKAADCVGEACNFTDYYSDVGRVPEHFRAKHHVMVIAQAVIANERKILAELVAALEPFTVFNTSADSLTITVKSAWVTRARKVIAKATQDWTDIAWIEARNAGDSIQGPAR